MKEILPVYETRLVRRGRRKAAPAIQTSQALYALVKPYFATLDREHLVVLYLDTGLHPTGCKLESIGSATQCLADKLIQNFWLLEFPKQPERLQADSLSPLQNKLGALIGNPMLRGILGQARSKLQLARVLREGKILLVNLSRGLLGQDASVLLGSLLLSLVEAAALGRAEQKEEERKPFFLYVDEFSFFATPAFIPMLAEGRKYGLGMTLAQQSLASLPPWLQADILTNSGSLVCFRVGAADAKVMAQEMAPVYEAGDLTGLPVGEFVVRMVVEGRTTGAFVGRTVIK